MKVCPECGRPLSYGPCPECARQKRDPLANVERLLDEALDEAEHDCAREREAVRLLLENVRRFPSDEILQFARSLAGDPR